MTIDSSDNVRMIRDSVGAIAPPDGDLKRIRALRNDPTGVDRETWQQIADLGWLALLLEESQGGLGLGIPELCAIAAELGSALVPEPVLAVAAMVPLLDEGRRDAVLNGSLIVVPAWRETVDELTDTCQLAASAGKVTGTKILVPSAAAAGAFVVMTANGAVLVERSAPGLALSLKKTQDGGQLATITMSDTPCTDLGGDARTALHTLSLAHSAYLLGAAERAFQMTLDYLGIRKQFGRYIGSFQVLQHRAAEAKIQLAISHAVLDEAVAAVAQGAHPEEQRRCAARAIARVSDTAMLVARESVQMHGAIGITDEHDIGLYCRKILSIYNQFGSASVNRARYLASIARRTEA